MPKRTAAELRTHLRRELRDMGWRDVEVGSVRMEGDPPAGTGRRAVRWFRCAQSPPSGQCFRRVAPRPDDLAPGDAGRSE